QKLSQNFAPESANYRPVRLSHPALTLLYTTFLKHLRNAHFLFYPRAPPERQVFVRQSRRTPLTYVLLLRWLRHGSHGPYGLLAIKTPPCARINAYAFPNEPR